MMNSSNSYFSAGTIDGSSSKKCYGYEFDTSPFLGSAKTLRHKTMDISHSYERNASTEFSSSDEPLGFGTCLDACTSGTLQEKDPKDICACTLRTSGGQDSPDIISSPDSISSATLDQLEPPSSFSSKQFNVDTILYPIHVSFGGDIINCGLAFMLLLMIILKILCAKFRTFSTFCALSISLLS